MEAIGGDDGTPANADALQASCCDVSVDSGSAETGSGTSSLDRVRERGGVCHVLIVR